MDEGQEKEGIGDGGEQQKTERSLKEDMEEWMRKRQDEEEKRMFREDMEKWKRNAQEKEEKMKKKRGTARDDMEERRGANQRRREGGQ